MAEKKKKSGFSIRKLIYNDKYLIIFSIICAVVIWVVTSMSLSPETTKTITVPVAVDFSKSAAEQLGIKCYGDETVNVEVNIKCKKYLAKDITADDINASLQTNYVTGTGMAQVPIRVSAGDNNEFEIQGYYPTTYTAFFDVESQKVMSVDINLEDEDIVQSGYILGKPLASESSVTVSGPASYVPLVNKISCAVNLQGEALSSTKSVSVTPVALDKNGNRVDYVTFLDSKGKAVTVLDLTIPVLKQTNLPVSVEFTNKPAKLDEGELGITYSTGNLNVGVLDDVELDSCVIGQIDFSKLKVGRNEFIFNIQNLESVEVLDDITEITVVVNVPLGYKTISVPVSAKNVKVSNMPDGYKYQVISISRYNVTAVGTSNNLSKVISNNASLSVNVKQYSDDVSEGTYTFDISPTIDNSEGCWIYGDYTATIRIYK